MLFNHVLGLQEVTNEKVNVNYREAVRAIIIQSNNILMVHLNEDKNRWVYRENVVLNELKGYVELLSNRNKI